MVDPDRWRLVVELSMKGAVVDLAQVLHPLALRLVAMPVVHR